MGDFFEICDQHFEANEASARTLERMTGATSGLSVEQQGRAARERLRAARGGDWAPFEQHLGALGARFARSGLEFASWYSVSNSFFEAIVPRLSERLGGEPRRLTEVLLVLGEYMERSMALIATEYLATKDTLRAEAEARHLAVIEASLDPVIVMDSEGVVTEFNAAAERTFGYSKVAAIGHHLADLVIPKADREAHRGGLARLIATGEARMLGRRLELTAIRADGSEVPVELAVVQTREGDGRASFTGFLRDLTERKAAESSNALWAHALDQAQFGVAISNVATRRITRVNAAYARLLGFAPDELVGTFGTEMVAESSRADIPAVQREVARTGFYTFVVDLKRKDGTAVSALISTSVVEIRPGERVQVSTVVDNSERQQLERVRTEAHEALAQSAERLEILSRTAHEFAAATGDQGALLALVAERLSDHIGDGCTVRLLSEDGEWTEPGARFHHRDPETCEAGRALLTPHRTSLGAGIARQVVSTGRPVLLPHVDPAAVIAQAPPAYHPMLTRMEPTSVLALPLQARGRTIGVASLLRGSPAPPYTIDDQRFAMDLADRAGLAIDNARLIATLEERVMERTAALEGANRELEAFSYSVSHDLRAPLRAIAGFSGALLADYGTQLDSQGQQYLDRIEAGTQRMSTLISDLLALAKVTGLPLERVRVDLSAIAADVLAELRRLDPERRVATHVVPDLTVLADPRLVRIVLENLLGNAWKFTAKREHTEISVGREGPSLFVRDNGAGFDLRYAAKLFRPFQRFHRSEEFEGTGIGLATVHRIVERHGGTITVETEPGRGATFRFSFGERP